MTAATRRLAAFLVLTFVGGVVVQVGLLRESPRDTVLMPVQWFFQLRQASDSWTSLEIGHAYVDAPHPRRTLYDFTFFSRRLEHKGFQYPPTSLLVMDAARAVFGRARPVLEAATWLCIPLAMALLVLLDHRLAREPASGSPAAGSEPAWAARAARAAVCAFAVLTFYPFIRAYANGQAQTWLNTLFLAAVLAWVSGRAATAGALVAAMTVVKPQAGILVVWALLRRRPRFLAGFAAVAVPALAASVWRYGFGAHVEYLNVLAFLGRRGESFFPNQSVNGLLHRLLENGHNLVFHRPGSALWMDHFPPYHPVVHAATVVSTVALVLWALWPPRSAGGRGGAADFCMAGVVSAVASPIAWEHHYGVLLPAFAVLYHRRLSAGLALWPLAVAYAVAGHSWWATRALAEGPLNVLQSYLLFAGLAVIALLHGAEKQPGGE